MLYFLVDSDKEGAKLAVKMQGKGDEMKVTYESRVLETRERNGYDDSDFYAVVFDDQTGDTTTVEYATTRFWTYNNSATVDADDETLERVEAVLTNRYFDCHRADHAARMSRVASGRKATLARTVRSKKNGTFAEGETGRVFWFGPDKYAPRWKSEAHRAGVEFADGRKHYFSTDDLVGVADSDFDAGAALEYAAFQAKQYVEAVRARRATKVAA
jgi:hypothetical protein